MAELVMLEFEGIGRKEYEAVNRQLGVDAYTGKGDWPSGLLMHSAAITDSGSFLVTEVWTSRETQASFMGRLGPALEAGGINVAPKVTWSQLVSHVPLEKIPSPA